MNRLQTPIARPSCGIRSRMATTKLLLPLIICSLLGTAPILVARASEAHAAATDELTISTTLNGSAYDVSVGGQKVASVPVSDLAHTVWTTISPDGSQLALITDYDTASGNGLSVLDVSDGSKRVVDPGRVTSASFSPDSSRLAYFVAQGGFAELRIADVTNSSRTVAEVRGRNVTALGWDEQGQSVYVVRHADTQSDGAFASRLSKLEVSSGQLRDLFTSEDKSLYRDFRLVTIGGKLHVSFIRAENTYICGGDQRLVLATADGAIAREFGVTKNSYRRALWSSDGSKVAYETQACLLPEETSAPEKAAASLADYNGIYLADVATGQSQRVVAGLSSTYSLKAVGNDGIAVGSARMGSVSVGKRTVDAGGPVRVESFPQVPESRAVTRIWAPYVNQQWDTRGGFAGKLRACGPTSAVMALGARELPEWWLWNDETKIDVTTPHWTDYGRYVTDAYSSAGTSFDLVAPDGAGSGAYGWMVDYAPGSCNGPCTHWNKLTDFLQKHGRDVSFRKIDTGGDPAWVRSQLDAGKTVIVTGAFSVIGHLSLITGYTSDGRFYVHDSFGPNTDGGYAGADQLYDWDYIQPKAFWASDTSASTTSRISVSARTMQDGSGVRPQGDADSRYPSVSHDGRYVAFESTATNLVNGDTNGRRDIFVRDRTNGTTNRASVAGSGSSLVESDGDSSEPSISGDGRYVAFQSGASNLGGGFGIYLRDRQAGTTTRLGTGLDPAISADGRYITYSTLFDVNDPVVGGQSFQIAVYDRSTGGKEHASVNGSGQLGNQRSYRPSISGDGRYVTFSSVASNLDGNPAGEDEHVYLRDRQAATTTLISKAPGGALGNKGSAMPALSADGRYVAYESDATNLVAEDTNGRRDVFRYDRSSGATIRVNLASDGAEQGRDVFATKAPTISADGRYVAFQSYANNLGPIDEGSDSDIFVHDTATKTTRRVSTASNGAEGNSHSFNAAISGDGRMIAFDSWASNLVAQDTAGKKDIFVHGPLTQAVVVDNYHRNNDVGLTKVEVTGTWRPSTYANGYWATGYQVGNEAGAVPGNFTFSFYLPSAGRRSIDAWWTEGPNRTARALYTVKDSAGKTIATVNANQQGSGSRWVALGVWGLPAGWNTVTLSSNGGAGVVIADAIRVR